MTLELKTEAQIKYEEELQLETERFLNDSDREHCRKQCMVSNFFNYRGCLIHVKLPGFREYLLKDIKKFVNKLISGKCADGNPSGFEQYKDLQHVATKFEIDLIILEKLMNDDTEKFESIEMIEFFKIIKNIKKTGIDWAASDYFNELYELKNNKREFFGKLVENTDQQKFKQVSSLEEVHRELSSQVVNINSPEFKEYVIKQTKEFVNRLLRGQFEPHIEKCEDLQQVAKYFNVDLALLEKLVNDSNMYSDSEYLQIVNENMRLGKFDYYLSNYYLNCENKQEFSSDSVVAKKAYSILQFSPVSTAYLRSYNLLQLEMIVKDLRDAFNEIKQLAKDNSQNTEVFEIVAELFEEHINPFVEYLKKDKNNAQNNFSLEQVNNLLDELQEDSAQTLTTLIKMFE